MKLSRTVFLLNVTSRCVRRCCCGGGGCRTAPRRAGPPFSDVARSEEILRSDIRKQFRLKQWHQQLEQLRRPERLNRLKQLLLPLLVLLQQVSIQHSFGNFSRATRLRCSRSLFLLRISAPNKGEHTLLARLPPLRPRDSTADCRLPTNVFCSRWSLVRR